MSTMTPEQTESNALGAISRSWSVLFFLGIISLVVGIVLIAWPEQTIVVIAVLVAIWLFISGIFAVVRAFGHGLSGGMRALLIITGVLSIFIAMFAFRGFRLEDSPINAVWILAVLVGISFLFRGMGALFAGIESSDGRGWNIFGGIVMLIGGFIILLWPGISLVTLAWVSGIWLVFIGIFEIIASLQVRSALKKLI
jgi:uncharacterized membrane protein HdeD (DUF308 family)